MSARGRKCSYLQSSSCAIASRSLCISEIIKFEKPNRRVRSGMEDFAHLSRVRWEQLHSRASRPPSLRAAANRVPERCPTRCSHNGTSPSNAGFARDCLKVQKKISKKLKVCKVFQLTARSRLDQNWHKWTRRRRRVRMQRHVHRCRPGGSRCPDFHRFHVDVRQ